MSEYAEFPISTAGRLFKAWYPASIRQPRACKTLKCGSARMSNPFARITPNSSDKMDPVDRMERTRRATDVNTDSGPARLRLCCAYGGGQLFDLNGRPSHMQLPLLSHELSRRRCAGGCSIDRDDLQAVATKNTIKSKCHSEIPDKSEASEKTVFTTSQRYAGVVECLSMNNVCICSVSETRIFPLSFRMQVS